MIRTLNIPPKNSGTYKIINIKNDKFYIGDTTHRKLASIFNVSKTTITDILNNKKWV